MTIGFVLVQAIRGKLPWLVAVPFDINLVANLIFSPIQFGMQNLPLPSVDILIMLGSIVWMIAAVWRHDRWVTLGQVPYLVRVSVAAARQLSITWMNWGR